MIVIPDLFGAYAKGRQKANEENWADLTNYEAVESARTANDLASLRLLGEQADFAGNRQLHSNSVLNDDIRTTENLLGHQGRKDDIRTGNILAGTRLDVISKARGDGRLRNYYEDTAQTTFSNADTGKVNASIDNTQANAQRRALTAIEHLLQPTYEATGRGNLAVELYTGKLNEDTAKNNYEIGKLNTGTSLFKAQNANDYNRGLNATGNFYGQGEITGRQRIADAQSALTQTQTNAEIINQNNKAQRLQTIGGLLANLTNLTSSLQANPDPAYRNSVVLQIQNIESQLKQLDFDPKIDVEALRTLPPPVPQGDGGVTDLPQGTTPNGMSVEQWNSLFGNTSSVQQVQSGRTNLMGVTPTATPWQNYAYGSGVLTPQAQAGYVPRYPLAGGQPAFNLINRLVPQTPPTKSTKKPNKNTNSFYGGALYALDGLNGVYGIGPQGVE